MVIFVVVVDNVGVDVVLVVVVVVVGIVDFLGCVVVFVVCGCV